MRSLKPILKGEKQKVRILRPSEYEMLREGARKLENQIQLDTLLLTGMRYVEAQRLHKHPEWFDGSFIHLPAEAQRKKKRKQRERWVRLNPLGRLTLPHFFRNKPLPHIVNFNKNLKRWAERGGLDPVGLCPKTLRKTWESWLVFYYPRHIHLIFLSQGHNNLTSLEHYLNMPFTEQDKEEMRKWVEGWI